MAIYYINPHSQTNGTGTYASPYSFSSSTRTALASGDEVRVLGVPLTSLLTSTVYTATYTSNYQLTITAGGGLGADFAANDVVYLPDVDAFIKISASSANIISISNTAILPWYNTSTGQTTITVRKVDTVTYPPCTTTGYYLFLLSDVTTSNITVSDGWTSATTRVTDGSVKSIMHAASSVGMYCYLDGNNTPSQSTTYPTNRTYSLENSHFLGGNGGVNASNLYIFASNVTANIGQLFTGGSGTAGIFYIGSSTSWGNNINATIKHLTNSYVSPNGINCTLSITNWAVQFPGLISGYSSVAANENFTYNINNVVCLQSNSSGFLQYAGSQIVSNFTYNWNGLIDVYQSVSTSTLGLTGAYGFSAINFGASFSVKYNRRTQTATSFGYLFYNPNGGVVVGQNQAVPTIGTPPGITISTTTYGMTGTLPNMTSTPNTVNTVIYSLPTSSYNASYLPNMPALANTYVLTFRDGSSPVEFMGIWGRYNSGSISAGLYPIASLDASVFRTTGPSLKMNLVTRSTSYWSAARDSKSVKPIKVPVTSGQAVTISGYIRTNIASVATGDFQVKLVINNTVVASQSLTGSAILNAWGSFSISYTPSITGEAYLNLEQYYAAAGSYWLDDLTIS